MQYAVCDTCISRSVSTVHEFCIKFCNRVDRRHFVCEFKNAIIAEMRCEMRYAECEMAVATLENIDAE